MATGAMIAGTLYAAYETKKAGDDAASAGRDNARLSRQETAEQVRRMKIQQAEELGTAKVGAAASGFAKGGTTDLYIDELAQEQNRELQWLEKTGRTMAAREEKMGKQAQRSANTSAITGLIQGASQTAQLSSQYGWMGFGK